MWKTHGFPMGKMIYTWWICRIELSEKGDSTEVGVGFELCSPELLLSEADIRTFLPFFFWQLGASIIVNCQGENLPLRIGICSGNSGGAGNATTEIYRTYLWENHRTKRASYHMGNSCSPTPCLRGLDGIMIQLHLEQAKKQGQLASLKIGGLRNKNQKHIFPIDSPVLVNFPLGK